MLLFAEVVAQVASHTRGVYEHQTTPASSNQIFVVMRGVLHFFLCRCCAQGVVRGENTHRPCSGLEDGPPHVRSSTRGRSYLAHNMFLDLSKLIEDDMQSDHACLCYVESSQAKPNPHLFCLTFVSE